MKQKRMRVSVSGGRTSMYMAIMLHKHCSDEYEFMFVFANTGCEHEDTLRFLRDAESNLGLPIVWVEAAPYFNKRKASGHKVVTFETASRNGEPYEQIIKKYGIPNVVGQYCTRELKRNALESYSASAGWPLRTYETAIGIRMDENRRVAKNATKDRIIYPLIDMFPSDKDDVLDYMEQFDWDLRIPEHMGNCVGCFKKSFRKLNMVYRQRPDVFEWTNRMEEKYPRTGTFQERHPEAPPNTFFRGNRSTKDIIAMFEEVGSPDNMPDEIVEGGCSESCEMYPTS